MHCMQNVTTENHRIMAILEALVITTLLTVGSSGVYGNDGELSTTTGDTVHIPCDFGEGTIRNLYWYYNDGTGPVNILIVFKGNVSVDAAYAHRASLHDDSSTLILTDIVVKDEGTYRCDVDREGQTAVPNINTILYVFSLTPDTVPEISECTEVDESSACTFHSNRSISITCVLRRIYPAEDAKLIWYQDGQLVTSPNDLMQNDDGTKDMIRQIQVSESGNFTCNASFLTAQGAENAAVSVGVTITPEPNNKNAPGNNLTKGIIAGIAIGVVLTVVVVTVVTICIYFIYCSRGNRSVTDGRQYSKVKDAEDIASSSSATTPPSTVNTTNTTAAATMTNATTSSSTPQAGSNSAHTTPDTTTTTSTSTTTTTTTNSTYNTTAATTTNATPTTSSSTQQAAVTGATATSTTSPSRNAAAAASAPTGKNTARTSPASSANDEFDDILEKIANELFKKTDINTLGKSLGFSPADIGRYIEENERQVGSYMGTLDMLRKWQQRQTPTEEREALRKALLQADMINLADRLLNTSPSGGVAQSQLSNGMNGETKKHPASNSSFPLSQTGKHEGMDRSGKRKVTSEEITELAKFLPQGKFVHLFNALRFDYNYHQKILKKHQNDNTAAATELLEEWKAQTGGYTDVLDKAMKKAGVEGQILQYKKVPEGSN